MPDILIRGMEMPHDCFGCEIAHLESTGLRCNLSHYSPKLDGRPQDCPLNELPPHGDLIDRDDVINGEADIISSDGYYAEFGFSRDMLRSMPVIVPSNKEKTE